jgi:ring-1,2-phenylacetyl-CoA epoxidase subunit PaaE
MALENISGIMSIHFHPIKIKRIKKETQDCVSVEFDIPDEKKAAFK